MTTNGQNQQQQHQQKQQQQQQPGPGPGPGPPATLAPAGVPMLAPVAIPSADGLLARPVGDGSPIRSPCLHRLMHIDSSGSSDSESCGSPKRGMSFEGKDVPPSPHAVNLDFMEEEKPLLPGVLVRAATVSKLANMGVQCFSHDSGDIREVAGEFPRVLLLMHQWFIPSEQLAERFMDLYNTVSSHVNCANPGCSHKYKVAACLHQQYRVQVCYLFKYWISTFPMHFDLNPRLSRCVQRFQDLLESSTASHLPALLDISKIPSYDWMRNMSVRNPNNVRAGKQVNLLFISLPPAELADQLTFLEYKAFRRITFNDFKHYAIQASLKDNPKLERSIALFNGLSQWVQCMILSKTTPQQRSEIIIKFVDVAKRLRQLQNFNTLMAVIGGLTHSALARLSKTNACIPPETQKALMEMTELLSSSNNFSNYRRVLYQCKGFRVPILGVHLKDLILLNTALPDKVEGVLINFRKMAQLSITFTELMLVQNSSLPVEPNMDLVNMIRLSLDLHYTEDEIYELSLAREPRNSLSSPSTPTKPVVFADWVAGVSPPDPNTINKHVNDMVEAVFKNYDHDKDGFISHAEFELIAGNFPFIDSFCVLDADQDGMISKSEMKTYFIRANCHALRNSFKHDFHEQTYFRPTFCLHCTGLLWGLIKQGWKCKDCGINAHKHCKDLVVMECRPKPHQEPHHHPLHKRSSLPNGSLTARRKSSHQHRRLFYSRGTQTNMDCSDCVLERAASLDRSSFDRGRADRGSLDRGGSFDRGDHQRLLERASLERGTFSRTAVTRGRLERASSDRACHDSGSSGLDRVGGGGSIVGDRTSGHISRSFDQSLVGGHESSTDCGPAEVTPPQPLKPAQPQARPPPENTSEVHNPTLLGELPPGTAPSNASTTTPLSRVNSTDAAGGNSGPAPTTTTTTVSNTNTLGPTSSTPTSSTFNSSSSSSTSTVTTAMAGPTDAEFYEEQSTLYERMLKAEEERDRVLAENEAIRAKCEQQLEQITTLKSQLSLIRQHTITFILDQMDTLHMQRDTEV